MLYGYRITKRKLLDNFSVNFEENKYLLKDQEGNTTTVSGDLEVVVLTGNPDDMIEHDFSTRYLGRCVKDMQGGDRITNL